MADTEPRPGGAAGTAGAGDRLEHAVGLAYRYLNRRDCTEAEVRGHLRGKRLGADVVEEAVRVLIEHGLVDDVRFARLFVHDKRALAEWGDERIRRGLAARGIDRELAHEALAAGPADGEPADGEPAGGEPAGAELASDEPASSELARALALLRRRFPTPPADRRERERALGVLLRKGYDSELALDALAQYAREPISHSFDVR